MAASHSPAFYLQVFWAFRPRGIRQKPLLEMHDKPNRLMPAAL